MAIDAFLKIEGVKGESVDKAHKDEIDVLSWSWGMSQSGTMHSGPGGGAGKVSVQDLSVVKYVDRSSPALTQACCVGTHFDKAVLTLRKAGGEPLDYLVITLEEVLVTSVQTGGSAGEERLTQSITLNFAKFKESYQPQNAKGGKEGGAIETGFDIAANVKI